MLPLDTHQVEDINGSGVIDNAHVTVSFQADGKVSGSTGCNRFIGSYAVGGHALQIKPLATTRRACVPAIESQQTRFLDVMKDVSSWDTDQRGRLVLKADNGSFIASSKAQN